MRLHEPDDAQIREVARGLVEQAGTDAAAVALTELYGRDRAIEALCRSATAGSSMGWAADIEVILDLTGSEPVARVVDPEGPDGSVPDLTAAPRPRPHTATEGHHVQVRRHLRPAMAARPYWL